MQVDVYFNHCIKVVINVFWTRGRIIKGLNLGSKGSEFDPL